MSQVYGSSVPKFLRTHCLLQSIVACSCLLFSSRSQLVYVSSLKTQWLWLATSLDPKLNHNHKCTHFHAYNFVSTREKPEYS